MVILEPKAYEGELFPETIDFAKQLRQILMDVEDNTPMKYCMQEICGHLNFTSTNQNPKVQRVTEPLPCRILGFHRCATALTRYVCPHFCIPDNLFNVLLTHPGRVLKFLSKFPSVIGPDFSIYPDMPLPEKLHRLYLNKLFTAWWQHERMRVYPNVVWVEGVPPEVCFDGLPEESFVFINSTGVYHNAHSRYVWREGYEAALALLKPRHIYRYGAKIGNEREDISTYFENDNKFAACKDG